jgi:hypothetical protein
MLTIIILALAMLAAFWSGFYVGYIKREDKKPPVPFVTDINEFAEEIMDKVREKMAKEKETEPQGFYD